MNAKRFLNITITVAGLITGLTLRGQDIDHIYEPIFVGHPPENAFNGLVQLPNGELRHYGFEGPQNNPTHHIFISSKDNGLSWHRNVIREAVQFAGENMPPATFSPYSGDFIRITGTKNGTFVLRSNKGIDGPYEKTQIDTNHYGMIRQPIFLKSKRRILVSCSGQTLIQDSIGAMQSRVFYSDNDGYTWNISDVPIGPRFKAEWPHRKSRWQNYAIEPTITELSDGRLWMLLRTSMDNLYESFSDDYGTTWSVPVPSRFYSTLTMPTLFRLKDGRLLLFFCNTTPLPEEDRSADTTLREEQKTGDGWEDVFTNRDAIHAAISADDGKTWTGFRELYLNPLRNERDFATRGGTEVSLDKSVHQSQAVELPYGKVLLAFGQHPLVRAMIIFDPDWLNETSAFDDFRNGLNNWSTFKYIKGIKGHCAYNRDPGAKLIDHPDRVGCKVLQIRHLKDSDLVCDVDGAVWNFPSVQKGSFTTHIYLKPLSKGGRISLNDRWFNPADTLSHRFSIYTIKFDGNGNVGNNLVLQPGRWIELTFIWNNLQTGSCKLRIDGKIIPLSIPINLHCINGISYVYFQSDAEKEDKEGYLIESVRAEVNGY
jgi:hypothetical protein